MDDDDVDDDRLAFQIRKEDMLNKKKKIDFDKKYGE